MLFRTLLLAATAVLASSPALAASPADVRAVADMVNDLSVPVLQRSRSPFRTGGLGGQIVFVEGGVRYTFYHSGTPIRSRDPNSAWLSMWARPNGSKGRAVVETTSDNGFDGRVDFGTGGTRAGLFSNNAMHLGDPTGIQNQAYWQRQYDKAIAAAIRYKRRHQR